MHYQRAKRQARGLRRPGPQPLPPEARFWAKVAKGGPDECWEWQGHRKGNGYGQFTLRRLVFVYAHRFAWEIEHGPIANGLHVLHVVCDNPPCVNVRHLKLGTPADNMADMNAKGRHWRARVGAA